ncbi:MAG TPA: glycosyltransferase [Bacteroidia bacterium]|jgi:cellulose synthase/poly-beta-1,6-N-acetylglucosamine synthase-like glycosyltransferase|nr:glycosyltransferase [Bacteroidia bacterium]
MLANIVLGLLCFCFAIYLFFCGIAYFRLAFGGKKTAPAKNAMPPASVIICARNEAVHIKNNLTLVLEQDYPTFEVIVVDDCSWDSTLTVLKEVQNDNPRLKVLEIKEDEVYKHGKKLALTIAIKSAQYDHLVFIDADCFPASKNWLMQIMQTFDEKTEIVLGYGAYSNKKGLINKMIRMDTFRIGLQYLSLALGGMPYMGVGRNLAYRKSFFLKQKGFSPYSQIPSGDDDLFVNKSATRYNTRIAASKDCITLSEPKKDMKEWLQQKRRHVSTAQYYKPFSKFILGIITFQQYFFWISAIVLLFFERFRFIALGIIGGYIIIQFIVNLKAMKRMGETKLVVYSLLLEWLLLFYFYPLVAISKLLFKQAAWKT